MLEDYALKQLYQVPFLAPVTTAVVAALQSQLFSQDEPLRWQTPAGPAPSCGTRVLSDHRIRTASGRIASFLRVHTAGCKESTYRQSLQLLPLQQPLSAFVHMHLSSRPSSRVLGSRIVRARRHPVSD